MLVKRVCLTLADGTEIIGPIFAGNGERELWDFVREVKAEGYDTTELKWVRVEEFKE